MIIGTELMFLGLASAFYFAMLGGSASSFGILGIIAAVFGFGVSATGACLKV